MTTDLFNLAGVVNLEHQKAGDPEKHLRKQHYTNRSPDVEGLSNLSKINKDTAKRKQHLSKSIQPGKQQNRGIHKEQHKSGDPYGFNHTGAFGRKGSQQSNKNDSKNQTVSSHFSNQIYHGGQMTHTIHAHALAAFNTSPIQPNLQRSTNKKHETILRESELEFKRKGKFMLVFPSNQSSICLYKNLFQQREASQDSLNWLLHNRFIERGIFI